MGMRLRAQIMMPIKLVVRPVWRRAWARLEARLLPISQEIASMHQDMRNLYRSQDEIASLSRRVDQVEDTWNQHIPGILNAVGSIRAFSFQLARQKDELARIAMQQAAETEKRTESVRAVAQSALDALASADDRITALEATIAQNSLTQKDDVSRAIDELRAEFERRVILMQESAVDSVKFRLEFVRREILFEMLHGQGSTARNEPVKIKPRFTDPEKLKASHNDLRINLGCGHIAEDGYINVDQRDLPHVDLQAEVGDLPFEPGSVSEIRSAHLLEHFPQEELRRKLLPYWRDLLCTGGTFRAIVPDGEAMLAGMKSDTYSFEDFREVLFGAQDYAGDFHFNFFTPDSLAALLLEADFREIEIPSRGRRNGKCFEFEIVAKRV